MCLYLHLAYRIVHALTINFAQRQYVLVTRHLQLTRRKLEAIKLEILTAGHQRIAAYYIGHWLTNYHIMHSDF